MEEKRQGAAEAREARRLYEEHVKASERTLARERSAQEDAFYADTVAKIRAMQEHAMREEIETRRCAHVASPRVGAVVACAHAPSG